MIRLIKLMDFIDSKAFYRIDFSHSEIQLCILNPNFKFHLFKDSPTKLIRIYHFSKMSL